jgi:hypothetical protein
MAQPKSIDEVVVLLDTLRSKTDPSNYFYTTISKYLSDPLKISPILLKEFNNIIRSFNYKKEIRYQIALDIFSDLLYNKAETLSNYEFIMLNGLFKKELLNKQLINIVIPNNINNLINLFEKDDKNKLILISYLMNECDFDNVKPYFVEFDHKDEYYLTMYKSEFLTDTSTPRFYSKKKQTFIKLINHILKSNQAEGTEGAQVSREGQGAVTPVGQVSREGQGPTEGQGARPTEGQGAGPKVEQGARPIGAEGPAVGQGPEGTPGAQGPEQKDPIKKILDDVKVLFKDIITHYIKSDHLILNPTDNTKDKFFEKRNSITQLLDQLLLNKSTNTITTNKITIIEEIKKLISGLIGYKAENYQGSLLDVLEQYNLKKIEYKNNNTITPEDLIYAFIETEKYLTTLINLNVKLNNLFERLDNINIIQEENDLTNALNMSLVSHKIKHYIEVKLNKYKTENPTMPTIIKITEIQLGYASKISFINEQKLNKLLSEEKVNLTKEIDTLKRSTPDFPGATPAVSTPAGSTPAVSTPAGSTPAVSTSAGSTPAVSTPAVSTPAGSPDTPINVKFTAQKITDLFKKIQDRLKYNPELYEFSKKESEYQRKEDETPLQKISTLIQNIDETPAILTIKKYLSFFLTEEERKILAENYNKQPLIVNEIVEYMEIIMENMPNLEEALQILIPYLSEKPKSGENTIKMDSIISDIFNGIDSKINITLKNGTTVDTRQDLRKEITKLFEPLKNPKNATDANNAIIKKLTSYTPYLKSSDNKKLFDLYCFILENSIINKLSQINDTDIFNIIITEFDRYKNELFQEINEIRKFCERISEYTNLEIMSIMYDILINIISPTNSNIESSPSEFSPSESSLSANNLFENSPFNADETMQIRQKKDTLNLEIKRTSDVIKDIIELFYKRREKIPSLNIKNYEYFNGLLINKRHLKKLKDQLINLTKNTTINTTFNPDNRTIDEDFKTEVIAEILGPVEQPLINKQFTEQKKIKRDMLYTEIIQRIDEQNKKNNVNALDKMKLDYLTEIDSIIYYISINKPEAITGKSIISNFIHQLNDIKENPTTPDLIDQIKLILFNLVEQKVNIDYE